MKYVLLLLALLIQPVIAADKEDEDKTITYTVKGEEVTVKASENPELAKFMEQIEAAAKKHKAREEGEADEETVATDGAETSDEAASPDVAAKAEPEPDKPALKTTPQTAEQLYNQGDFETAYDHYKALSAEGDAEASLMLAIMNSKGQGVETDEAAAHAWFTRAAEQGNPSAGEFIEGTRLTATEKEKSRELYKEIAQEFDEPEKAEKAEERFAKIQQSSHTLSRPATVDRTDPGSLKVKTYKRPPAGTYSETPARTYSAEPVKSYGAERFELERYRPGQ